MKRVFALTLSAALALSLLSGCSNSGSKETVVPNDPSEAVESGAGAAAPAPAAGGPAGTESAPQARRVWLGEAHRRGI